MNRLHVRVGLESDDGGIRQVEKQYIPEIAKCGDDVVGVIIGSSYGNYSNQREDFRYLVEGRLKSFNKGFLSRVFGYIYNRFLSKKIALDIYNKLNDKEDLAAYNNIIVTISRPNLIHVALLLAEFLRGRVTMQLGGSFNNGPFYINKLVYWRLRKRKEIKLIANSKYSAESYKLRENDFVYPGFDSDRLFNSDRSLKIRNGLDIENGSPVLLYLARISKEKAPDLLVEAFLTSDEAKAQNAHLIIAGPVKDESLYKYLIKLISSIESGNRVHLVGEQKDVGNWYRCADIFVNSQRGIEPFGISIVEAMSLGKPILTSAYGGPAETVQPGVNGWHINDLSVAGYKEGINKALIERDNWVAYGDNSERLSHKFTAGNQVKKYIELINKWN